MNYGVKDKWDVQEYSLSGLLLSIQVFHLPMGSPSSLAAGAA